MLVGTLEMIGNSEGNITTFKSQILILMPGATVYGWRYFTAKRVFMRVDSFCNMTMTKG
jgi:hypothetical protein